LNNIPQFLIEISIWAVPTIFAIILHEIMHGVIALQLGDDTALRAGRLTLNPLHHIDPFGTIILPALLLFLHMPVFGYAKPVPVDFRRLNPRRLGMMLVAAAGPLTNLTLAILSAIGMRVAVQHLNGPLGETVVLPLAYMFRASVFVNVILGVFNLFPLLPLDGGRVLTGMLPLSAARVYSRLEPYGFLILLLLLYTDSVERVINPIINSIVQVLI
jgi:Zn-dependent protease